jgi:hypothetical protein
VSLFLAYFETVKKFVVPKDRRLFKMVNQFEIPEPLAGYPCHISIDGKMKNGQLIFYGGYAPPFFRFNKDPEGQQSAQLRKVLIDFVKERLYNEVVQPVLIPVWLDNEYEGIVYPASPPEEISIAALTSDFVSGKRNTMFIISA